MAYQSNPRRPRSALAEDIIRKQRHAARREAEDRRRLEREAAKRRSAKISMLSLLVIIAAVGYLAARLIMNLI